MTDIAEKEVISGLTCICIVGIEVSVSLLLFLDQRKYLTKMTIQIQISPCFKVSCAILWQFLLEATSLPRLFS